MAKRHTSGPAAMLLLLPLLVANSCSARAASGKTAVPPEPQPAVTIPVQPLGFEPPSLFSLARRPSELTLNFLDATHLLFTFRVNGLLARHPGSHPREDGQIIRADVLDLATGKVVRQAQWTMQDRGRYLWALPGGKFLIRRGNTLYRTDDSLQLKPWLASPLPLLYVSVSPDRRQIAVEQQQPPTVPSLAPAVDLRGHPLDRPSRVKITVYRAATQTVLFTSEAPRPVALPLVRHGFVQLFPKATRDDWTLRRVRILTAPLPTPKPGQPAQVSHQDIFTLHSGCAPSLLPLSATVLLAGCSGDGQDHPMTALNLAGQPLWNQWWQARYVWHTIAYAENGSRFALGSLITDSPDPTPAALDPQSVQGQIVGVFNTLTGKLVLVRDAQPIVSAGQNFALSADGRQFAILRRQAIEVYLVPPLPQTSSPPDPAASLAAKKR
jgi:hypothetical protein